MKTVYTAEFWQYDARLGRRWNIDPVFKAFEGSYSCFGGNPIWFIDPDGRDYSDHIDRFGNIIAHYDDGDNSVYLHTDGITKKLIDAQRSLLNNTQGYGMKVGELGGNIDISVIMENKLKQSAQEARNMNLYDYYLAVKTNGRWDLKNNKKTIFGLAWEKRKILSTTFSFGNNTTMSASDVGNYHAGYAGRAANIPHYLLWKGAGAAETFKEFKNGNYLKTVGRLFLLTRYWSLLSGDRLVDFKWNTKGMFDYDNENR